MNGIPIRAIVLFPFTLGTGPETEKTLRVLKEVMNAVQLRELRLHTSTSQPILFVNRISKEKGHFNQICSHLESDLHKGNWDIVTGWSVDTCQDWLYGWGKAVDDYYSSPSPSGELGLLQIPGDLTDVGVNPDRASIRRFLEQLEVLSDKIAMGEDLVIGNYDTDQWGGKRLIDTYGTFPLLHNWFPEVARQIRTKYGISRPRSEFVGAKVTFLREMLIGYRRFAYEETTALLINTIYDMENITERLGHRPKIRAVDLGQLQDHVGERGFRESLEQLERMERMMRLLWRVLHGGDRFDVNQYSSLDETSSAIRAAAMVTLRNYLHPGD